MKEPGEGQAENGPQEERADDNLLLERGHKRHIGPEHVHNAQTEKEQASCRHKGNTGYIYIYIYIYIVFINPQYS